MPELHVGDLIIEGKIHVRMWVGGEKAILHNVDRGTFSGVMRQSLKSGFIGSKSTPDEFFLSSRTDTNRVYRSTDAALAKEAAEFAIGWATESGSKEANIAVSMHNGVLKSKYSQERLVYAEYDAKVEEREWSAGALFRVLKSYARFQEAVAPKHGSTCSQFATYCYQAAMIKRYFGELNISEEKLKQIKSSGSFRKLQAKGDEESQDIIGILNRSLEILETKHIPSSIKMNAKVQHVEHFKIQLEAENSDFSQEGFFIPSSDFTKAAVCKDPGENWKNARKKVGF